MQLYMLTSSTAMCVKFSTRQSYSLGYAKDKGAFYFVVMWKSSSSTALETEAAPLHNNVRAEQESCEDLTVDFKTTL